jgi:hypothetical protein
VATEREPAHERRDRGRGGEHADPEHERERPQPQLLVDEPGGTGEQQPDGEQGGRARLATGLDRPVTRHHRGLFHGRRP